MKSAEWIDEKPDQFELINLFRCSHNFLHNRFSYWSKQNYRKQTLDNGRSCWRGFGYVTGKLVDNNYRSYTKIKASERTKNKITFHLEYNFGHLEPGLVYTFRR